jgi:hypothetical protein
MQATPGSTIAPILLDAPQGIGEALSVRIERMPEETLIAGPYTGTATEYEQDDGTSNYQATPILLPTDIEADPPGEVRHSIAWTHASLGVSPVRIPLPITGLPPSVVTFAAVMAAVESMMKPRLRLGSEGGQFSAGSGTLVDHFQNDPPTRPTLSTATEVITRHMGEAAVDYNAAEDVDAPSIITVAALRSAIELESTHYPEQVNSDRSPARVWIDLLARYEDRLAARESTVDIGEDEGGPGLDAVWGFGSTSTEGILAPGSEYAIPVETPRRRVW